MSESSPLSAPLLVCTAVSICRCFSNRVRAGSYGDLTWEWAPETQLRGYTHPLLFAALYKVLALMGLDSSNTVMVYAPRILQAACATVCDCAVYRLARRWFDESAAKWALACSLLSWFNCFCAVRPFSNCLEATLCTAALSLWPFNSASSKPQSRTVDITNNAALSPPTYHRVAALLLGAAACSLRPPTALVWAVLGGHHLLQLLQGNALESGNSSRFTGKPVTAAFLFLCEAVGCVALVFALCGVIDRLLYGEWTFPPWNFLVWNAVTVRWPANVASVAASVLQVVLHHEAALCSGRSCTIWHASMALVRDPRIADCAGPRHCTTSLVRDLLRSWITRI
eukprot:COSAG02_NODE_799_length_17084_cov_9.741242_3_plen_340_part_00